MIYKIIEGNNFIWLRVDKNSGLVRNFHSSKEVNEYQFIIDFLESNPDLIIKDEQEEVMHIEII